MGGFITTNSFQDQNLPYDQRVSALEREMADLIRQLKQAALDAKPNNVVPTDVFAGIEGQINRCIAALEALRMGRSVAPEEVQATEKRLLAVERQILNVEAQQFASICASVSVRNQLERRLSELRQQAVNMRGQLQVFTGRQRDAETRAICWVTVTPYGVCWIRSVKSMSLCWRTC